jgi:hypothetical protein
LTAIEIVYQVGALVVLSSAAYGVYYTVKGAPIRWVFALPFLAAGLIMTSPVWLRLL